MGVITPMMLSRMFYDLLTSHGLDCPSFLFGGIDGLVCADGVRPLSEKQHFSKINQ